MLVSTSDQFIIHHHWHAFSVGDCVDIFHLPDYSCIFFKQDEPAILSSGDAYFRAFLIKLFMPVWHLDCWAVTWSCLRITTTFGFASVVIWKCNVTKTIIGLCKHIYKPVRQSIKWWMQLFVLELMLYMYWYHHPDSLLGSEWRLIWS